jgi:hypothetical protein
VLPYDDHRMTVQETILRAEAAIRECPLPQAGSDSRWQAIIQVGHFIESDPEPVWSFIQTWGNTDDPDLRMALATCLLEHLLEHHFDQFISRVEDQAKRDRMFADTVRHCWKFGLAEEPSRTARLQRLQQTLRRRS